MRVIKTAVITGPTGAIGIALTELLLSRGIKVYAVCRKDSKRINSIPVNAEKIFASLNEMSTLDKLISESIDAFFHLAWNGASGNGRNNAELQKKNVEYSLDALLCSKRLGAKVFVGAGSQAQYGLPNAVLTPETPCVPVTEYGKAKLEAEELLRIKSKEIGIDFFWPRILSVYGPYDGENSMISITVKKLLQNKKPSLTSGAQYWDYLYSADAASAMLAIAKKGVNGRKYVVASGNSQPLKNYVLKLRDSINSELPLGFGEIETKDGCLELRADISLLTRDTGFVPEISFEEGIIKTVNYYKQLSE